MPAFSVSESITIQAPQESVFDTLRDFKSWPTWSPWVIAEPDAKLIYADDGQSYSWDGKLIGAGKLGWISESGVESLTGELTFLRPHKGQAETRFKLEPSGKGTRVTWEMDSKLPFFMFPLKKMFSALVSMDYKRGLSMLKDYIEDGEIHSRIEFDSQQSPELTLVGIRKECQMSEIGPEMKECLCKLSELEGIGKGISIYHKWDVASQMVTFTTGFLIENMPSDLPEGATVVTIPATPAYTVTHTGPYTYLGNAWSSGICHQRAKVFKKNNRIHPFEIYENDPSKVNENELVTVVYFPKK